MTNEEIKAMEEKLAAERALRVEDKKRARSAVGMLYIAEREKVNGWLTENGYPSNAVSELAVGIKIHTYIKQNLPDVAKYYTSPVSVTNVGREAMKAK